MTTIDEMKRLAGNIQWKSVDKDNMEFEARASCYQVDAIRTLLAHTADYDALTAELAIKAGQVETALGTIEVQRLALQACSPPRVAAHTADYDALKGRLEEAVRLMQPFADEINAVSDTIPDGHDISDEAWPDITFGQMRALAAFVNREKEAVRG